MSIKFIWNNETICFSSVYLPQKNIKEIGLFTEYVKKLLALNHSKLVICGDLNCWLGTIGKEDNQRGKLLFNNLSKLGLVFEDIPDPTRIGYAMQHDSYVDHIIRNCFDCIKNVKVLNKISDHKIIASSIVGDSKNMERHTKYDFLNTYKCKGSVLDQVFDDYDWLKLFDSGDINVVAENFNDDIIDIWDRLGIKKKVNRSSKPEYKPFIKNKLKK